MFGLVIVEEAYDEDGVFVASHQTLYFNEDLHKIADYWIDYFNLELTELLRSKIVDKTFWYTHYNRDGSLYTVRVFEVQPDVEIYV